MKIAFQEEITPNQSLSEDKIIKIILKNRSIKNQAKFLNPDSPLNTTLKDFGLKKEFNKIIPLLKKIKKNQEMIVIYTDFDADGITGGAILWETLYFLGFKVMPYVPHRQNEGYGFSKKGIDKIKKLYKPSLIISVDHGITADEEVTYAKTLKIPIIITDHHLKPKSIPKNAQAIFHIPQLSGSGVAYFFAKEIYNYFIKETDQKTNQQLTINFQTDYLCLATIGTIADLVPLTDYSRSIAKYGLNSFSKTKRIGIKHILKEANIENKNISTYEVGFIIAPRINALGRLEHAINALRLLCTNQTNKAQSLANHMGLKNKERQDMVKKAVAQAEKQVEALIKAKKLNKIIILKSDRWHEGIIGLIASRIVEKYYRPTIVLTESNGIFKASARSIPCFHITNFLQSLKKFLINVGGHKQAAGFTIEKNKLNLFINQAFKKANKIIDDKDLIKTIQVDLKIPVSQVNLKLARLIEKLEPFGIGNPKPKFYSQVEIIKKQTFGKNNNHLKLFVKDPLKDFHLLELIIFNSKDEFFNLLPGNKVDVVYNLEINRWQSNEKLRGNVKYLF